MSVIGGAKERVGTATPADQVGTAADSPQVVLRSSAGTALIAATVLASAVGSLDANVIKVAVPAIGRSLGASVVTLQWTLTGYLLTVAALLLLSGALADRFGRRRVLVTGLFVMLASSVLCAVAPSVGVLIVARVAQGVGGAMVVPSSLALLNGTLRVADRARGIGIWAGLETLGTTVGPYAGGWLVDHASWRWVFVIDVPLILAGLLVLRRVPETSFARRPLSPDVLGGDAGSGRARWCDLRVDGRPRVRLAERAGADRGHCRSLLADRIGTGRATSPRADAPTLAVRLASVRRDQFDHGVALRRAGHRELHTLPAVRATAGLLGRSGWGCAVPESAIFLLISPLSGVLVSHVGPRWLMVSGILMVAASFIWLSGAQPGVSYAGAILPPTVLWGLGIGLTVTPLTAAVLAAVRDADLGEASAINDAASRLGGLILVALVPALIGATAGRSLDHALVHGYQPAMIALGGICVAAALIAAVFVADNRAAVPRLAAAPRDHGCALSVADTAATP